jgi:8-oxo-dGTP diphosphatase
MPHTYEYPRPSVTVDCVVFGFNGERRLKVLLIRRAEPPFKGKQALPGGFVNVSDKGDQGESLEDAARRELAEETGVEIAYLEQLYTFGAPGRDPRGRVIDVAYFALVRSEEHAAHAGSDAASASWVDLQDALKQKLAFDHSDVLAMASRRLRAKVRYAPIGFNLLPREFTIADIRALYEATLGRKLDVSNFHKRILATEILEPTGGVREGAHRPAALFKFNRKAYDKAMRDGFNFEV